MTNVKVTCTAEHSGSSAWRGASAQPQNVLRPTGFRNRNGQMEPENRI